MKPHKHAALIKAWADGAVIEYFMEENEGWIEVVTPSWVDRPGLEFRIAPIQPADENGWRPWYGGENPAPGKMVEFKCRSEETNKSLTDDLYWKHDDEDIDIIAWREVPEVKQKVKKVYYLWAYPSGSVMFREEGWNSTGSSAIRLDWSRTEIEE